MKVISTINTIYKTLILLLLPLFIIQCRSGKGTEISSSEKAIDTEPRVLFINLKVYDADNLKTSIELITRNKGKLKESIPTTVTTESGQLRFSFMDDAANIVAQIAMDSPLEQYHEVVNDQGKLERILIKKNEEYMALRVNDNGRISMLVVERLLDQQFTQISKFDISN